jgi:hypothetical protein
MSEYSIPDFNALCLAKRGPVVYQENRPYVAPGAIAYEIDKLLAGTRDPRESRCSDEILLIHLVLYKRADAEWLNRMTQQYPWVDDMLLLWDTGLSIEDIYQRLYDVFHPTKGALDGSSSN